MLFSFARVFESKLNNPLIIPVVSGIMFSNIHKSGQFRTPRFSTSFALRIICCLKDVISALSFVGNTSVQDFTKSSFSFSSLWSISQIFVIDSLSFSFCVALRLEYEGVNST